MNPKNNNEKLEELVKDLALKINMVLEDSPVIKEALQQIEGQGYKVDLVLASITRILKPNKQHSANWEELSSELNTFDRAFLKAIKVKPSEE